MTRAVERVTGSLLGLVLAGVFLIAGASEVVIVLLVALLQLGIELVVARNYTLALLMITPQALLMAQLANPQELGPLLLDRGLETVIGAAAAVVIATLAGRIFRGAPGPGGAGPGGAGRSDVRPGG